jgi:hypothetical protein
LDKNYLPTDVSDHSRSLCNFVHAVFSKICSDDQFLEKSGPDAVQYLSYQRHLIFLASVITLTSLVIVLPINLQGKKNPNASPDIGIFEQSTIFNLGSE